jgi:NAD:arginine ADP-ribosyltransferase
VKLFKGLGEHKAVLADPEALAEYLDEHKKHISAYIRGALMNVQNPHHDLNDLKDMYSTAEGLSVALARLMPVEEGSVVFRGVPGVKRGVYGGKIRAGDFVSYHSRFMSTSKSIQTAFDFSYLSHAQKNKKVESIFFIINTISGRDITQLGNPEQEEILHPGNRTFRVNWFGDQKLDSPHPRTVKFVFLSEVEGPFSNNGENLAKNMQTGSLKENSFTKNIYAGEFSSHKKNWLSRLGCARRCFKSLKSGIRNKLMQ